MTEYFAPLRAKSAEPLQLDMQSLFLSGRILPFGAKLNVTHVFRSSEPSPLEVVYCFPLPRDATMVSFKIQGPGFSIISSLEPKAAAEKRYEKALEAGSTAAFTIQNRDGMVNLTVGNLRPGETVSVHLDLVAGLSLTDRGFRLRFPFTVAPCYHAQMRASLSGHNVGILELPDSVSGGVMMPPIHKKAEGLHQVGFNLEIQPAAGIREVASPSHSIRMALGDGQRIGVNLSPDRDVPNRDLVLDVSRDWNGGQAWSDRPVDDRKHFALLVPSSVFGQPAITARRVVFLLDRSGSMQGTPLKQALSAVEHCLATLSRDDQFNIVAFDSIVSAFRPAMLSATPDHVEEAVGFLNTIVAQGGTELAQAIEKAAGLLGGSGQVFVITDGQVSETVEILRRARKSEAHLFCLGIGTASQDRFLELLARQTGGVCRFVTPAETIGTAAKELFAALGGTLATDVQVADAHVEPRPSGPVFAGTPFFAFGDVLSDAGSATVQWAGRSERIPFQVLNDELLGLVEKLQGARLIADLEAQGLKDETGRARLLELSQRFGLASSEMSLVAVVERVDDRSGHLTKTVIVPMGMPEQTEFTTYFGQSSIAPRPILSLAFYREAPDASSTPPVAVRIGAGRPKAAAPFSAKDALLSTLREIFASIDNGAALRADKQANNRINQWLKDLVFAQNRPHNDIQTEALAALIDFLSSDLIDFLESGQFNQNRWREIQERTESAWPESAVFKK